MPRRRRSARRRRSRPVSRPRPRKPLVPARSPSRRTLALAAQLSGAATARATVTGTLETGVLLASAPSRRRRRDGRGRPVKLSLATFQKHVAEYPDLSDVQRAKRLSVLTAHGAAAPAEA
jgi:hypothetical protein